MKLPDTTFTYNEAKVNRKGGRGYGVGKRRPRERLFSKLGKCGPSS